MWTRIMNGSRSFSWQTLLQTDPQLVNESFLLLTHSVKSCDVATSPASVVLIHYVMDKKRRKSTRKKRSKHEGGILSETVRKICKLQF